MPQAEDAHGGEAGPHARADSFASSGAAAAPTLYPKPKPQTALALFPALRPERSGSGDALCVSSVLLSRSLAERCPVAVDIQ